MGRSILVARKDIRDVLNERKQEDKGDNALICLMSASVKLKTSNESRGLRNEYPHGKWIRCSIPAQFRFNQFVEKT